MNDREFRSVKAFRAMDATLSDLYRILTMMPHRALSKEVIWSYWPWVRLFV